MENVIHFRGKIDKGEKNQLKSMKLDPFADDRQQERSLTMSLWHASIFFPSKKTNIHACLPCQSIFVDTLMVLKRGFLEESAG